MPSTCPPTAPPAQDRPGGNLLLSGFYESDVPVLQQRAQELGLTLTSTKTREGWCALRFNKTA